MKVEAEILVALEALKTSFTSMSIDINSLLDKISSNTGRIGANQEDVWEDMDLPRSQILVSWEKVELLMD